MSAELTQRQPFAAPQDLLALLPTIFVLSFYVMVVALTIHVFARLRADQQRFHDRQVANVASPASSAGATAKKLVDDLQLQPSLPLVRYTKKRERRQSVSLYSSSGYGEAEAEAGSSLLKLLSIPPCVSDDDVSSFNGANVEAQLSGSPPSCSSSSPPSEWFSKDHVEKEEAAPHGTTMEEAVTTQLISDEEFTSMLKTDAAAMGLSSLSATPPNTWLQKSTPDGFSLVAVSPRFSSSTSSPAERRRAAGGEEEMRGESALPQQQRYSLLHLKAAHAGASFTGCPARAALYVEELQNPLRAAEIEARTRETEGGGARGSDRSSMAVSPPSRLCQSVCAT